MPKSDYFLTERLREQAVWREDDSEALARVRDLYAARKDVLNTLNEAQTEEEFIKPVLREVLGWSFDVQGGVKRQGRINRLDYIFFPDEAAKSEALKHRLDETPYYERAVAVGSETGNGRPFVQKTILRATGRVSGGALAQSLQNNRRNRSQSWADE